MKKLYFLLFFSLGLCLNANAQNFKGKQKSQERTIKAAFKSGKVTEREYYKLLDEQEAIKQAIAKYQADDVWTPHEKNVIHDKLVRAEKRLRRYKTNGEVY
ncbi:MAG TPA: hypothetical protein PL009_04090 [Flavipsychrobacter sp.]|nr:hypothetical protein [Flavipsychrobacter sp.]